LSLNIKLISLFKGKGFNTVESLMLTLIMSLQTRKIGFGFFFSSSKHKWRSYFDEIWELSVPPLTAYATDSLTLPKEIVKLIQLNWVA